MVSVAVGAVRKGIDVRAEELDAAVEAERGPDHGHVVGLRAVRAHGVIGGLDGVARIRQIRVLQDQLAETVDKASVLRERAAVHAQRDGVGGVELPLQVAGGELERRAGVDGEGVRHAGEAERGGMARAKRSTTVRHPQRPRFNVDVADVVGVLKPDLPVASTQLQRPRACLAETGRVSRIGAVRRRAEDRHSDKRIDVGVAGDVGHVDRRLRELAEEQSDILLIGYREVGVCDKRHGAGTGEVEVLGDDRTPVRPRDEAVVEVHDRVVQVQVADVEREVVRQVERRVVELEHGLGPRRAAPAADERVLARHAERGVRDGHRARHARVAERAGRDVGRILAEVFREMGIGNRRQHHLQSLLLLWSCHVEVILEHLDGFLAHGGNDIRQVGRIVHADISLIVPVLIVAFIVIEPPKTDATHLYFKVLPTALAVPKRRMASERGSTILGNWFKPFTSPQMTVGLKTLIKS